MPGGLPAATGRENLSLIGTMLTGESSRDPFAWRGLAACVPPRSVSVGAASERRRDGLS